MVLGAATVEGGRWMVGGRIAIEQPEAHSNLTFVYKRVLFDPETLKRLGGDEFPRVPRIEHHYLIHRTHDNRS